MLISTATSASSVLLETVLPLIGVLLFVVTRTSSLFVFLGEDMPLFLPDLFSLPNELSSCSLAVEFGFPGMPSALFRSSLRSSNPCGKTIENFTKETF
jgi:hypothetical protein